MALEPIVNLTATVDALRRRKPNELARLAREFPELNIDVEAKRPLGGVPQYASVKGVRELAEVAAKEVRSDLSELLEFLAKRTKLLAAIRLTVGIGSTIATASVVAILVGEGSGQVIGAIVAFITTLVGLFVTYLEDFSGGQGSTKKMRDAMVLEVRRLADADSILRIGIAISDDAKILDALSLVNQVFGEVQAARAKIGLSV